MSNTSPTVVSEKDSVNWVGGGGSSRGYCCRPLTAWEVYSGYTKDSRRRNLSRKTTRKCTLCL